MDVSKKGFWEILTGVILVVTLANVIPMFLGGSTQAMVVLAVCFLAIIVGFYLIYRGFRSKSS